MSPRPEGRWKTAVLNQLSTPRWLRGSTALPVCTIGLEVAEVPEPRHASPPPVKSKLSDVPALISEIIPVAKVEMPCNCQPSNTCFETEPGRTLLPLGISQVYEK